MVYIPFIYLWFNIAGLGFKKTPAFIAVTSWNIPEPNLELENCPADQWFPTVSY